MARILTVVSLATLVSGALSWVTAFRLAPGQGWRYHHSVARHLFVIGALTGLTASVLTVWP